MTDDAAVRGGGETRRVLAVLGHHDLHELARARRIGQRRARHAGKHDALQHVDLSQAAGEPTDDGVAEAHEPVHDAARTHDGRGQDEQRDRQQQEALVGAVEKLLGHSAHVHALEEQVQDGATEHDLAHGNTQQAEHEDGAERQRERTGEVHSAELFCSGEPSAGSLPRSNWPMFHRCRTINATEKRM